MTEILRVWRWREAVAALVARNVQVRYKNSALGFLWSFLNPVMQIVVMTVAFRYIMNSPIENFSVHLFAVYLPWMFFQQSLGDGSTCILENAPLLRKYPFPRIVLPAATIISNFVHMVLSVLVLVVILLYLRVAIRPVVLYVPVFVGVLLVFLLGLMLLIAVMRMYYEDIRFALEAVLRLWFFLTPLVYNMQQVLDTERLSLPLKQLYVLLNPVTPLMVGMRAALLEPDQWPPPMPPAPGGLCPGAEFWFYFVVSAVVALIALAAGVHVWRKYEWKLPELM